MTVRRQLEKVLNTSDFILRPIRKEGYTQQELYTIQEKLNARWDQLANTPAIRNLSSAGIGTDYISIRLIVNTPQTQQEFRRTVMDSPAFRLEGPETPVKHEITGVKEANGVYIRPEYEVYSTSTNKINFIISNRTDVDLLSGMHYIITYEDKEGIWRKYPMNDIFTDLGVLIRAGQDYTYTADLDTYLHTNTPGRSGRYRFLYNVTIGNQNNVLMMAEFRLSDEPDELKRAIKTPAPPLGILFPLEEEVETFDGKVFDIVERMPEFPNGGMHGMRKFIASHIPQDIPGEGQVVVGFIVTKDGSLANIQIQRSMGKQLDEIAVDIVKKMPKWIPGFQGGKPVNVRYIIGITFKK